MSPEFAFISQAHLERFVEQRKPRQLAGSVAVLLLNGDSEPVPASFVAPMAPGWVEPRLPSSKPPRTHKPRTCLVCNATYTPKSPSAKFCAECRAEVTERTRTAAASKAWKKRYRVDEPGHVVTCDPAFDVGMVE